MEQGITGFGACSEREEKNKPLALAQCHMGCLEGQSMWLGCLMLFGGHCEAHVQPNKPIAKFHEHTAAVKAIGWSPHQNGLLATGGGTADRHIRFWNTHTLQPLHAIDTGSQVCNLMFSKTTHEIVSTHGYSLNQIILWKYPSMQKIQTLTGHSQRVLYLSISPCG